MTGAYETNINSFCSPNTRMSSNNKLDATQECTQNSACTMFWDRCGNGNEFYFCTDGSEIKSSPCGSFLYIMFKGGKNKYVELS